MAYTPVIAAALSGATVRQLSYWRSARTTESLLAPAHHTPRARVAYSFQDVVALRTFVYLRSRDVPLQRVRKAIRSLRRMGETDHLAAYQLVAMGRNVAWRMSDESAVDLTERPGQHVIAQMVEIFDAFRSMQGREVLPLLTPKPGVRVDPDIRGGYPVIEGTRVPFDLVASLLEDGVAAADIGSFYPSVSAGSALGALDFARYVDTHRGAPAAA